MNSLSLKILAVVFGMLVNNIIVSADQIERGPATDYVTAVDFEEKVAFRAKEQPGNAGWVKLYLFGNGDIGLAFVEIRRKHNPRFTPPSIEFLQAAGYPYQYGRTKMPAVHPELLREGVFLKSTNSGLTWEETGRRWGVSGTTQAYPDGRLVQMVSAQGSNYEFGNDRHYTSMQESHDGGNTWKQIARLLDGFVLNTNMKKLRDGSLAVLCAVSPTWGPGGSRMLSQSAFPGERNPAQTAFMHSPDGGYTWTGPHYVLQGITAWEADFLELPDGRLLVFNSSVQMGATVRQIVHRTKTGFVCEPVYDVQKGGAEGDNIQSGIMPEKMDLTANGMIIGARRGSYYACSNDLGDTWHRISNTPRCAYQPQVLCLPDGRFMAVWHRGTDSVYGQQDMYVGTHTFRLNADLPKAAKLTLARTLSQDHSQYVNIHHATLTVGGNPVPGKTIELRVEPTWRPDGIVNNTPIGESTNIMTAVTNGKGVAEFVLKEFDLTCDIHHSNYLQASFTPKSNEKLSSCKSSSYSSYSMTDKRNTPFAYPIYFSENVLFISAPTAQEFPELVDLVEKFERFDVDATFAQWADAIGNEDRAKLIIDFLVDNYALSVTNDGKYHWYRSIHCGPKIIEHVRIGDLPDYNI